MPFMFVCRLPKTFGKRFESNGRRVPTEPQIMPTFISTLDHVAVPVGSHVVSVPTENL